MPKPVVIFDFDGTLADTLGAIVQITNQLAEEFGYKPSSPEDLALVRSMGAWQIIQRSGISPFKVPKLIRKLQRELHGQIPQIQPFPGITEMLLELHNQGLQLGIVTSNTIENVNAFLQVQHLQDYFTFTISGTTLFGKHQVLNKLIKQHHLTPTKVIYVGDETRDIEAARKTHIKCISVTWGFNSAAVLSAHHPDYLAHHPAELLAIIQNLTQGER